MTFVQIIEYETTRAQEVDQLFADWLSATEGKRTATHELHAQDRDNTSHFVDIVEFPSYEEAMRNNDLPETRSVAERMRSLCTSEPRFVNLEVLRGEAT
jgi:hypothetical protein